MVLLSEAIILNPEALANVLRGPSQRFQLSDLSFGLVPLVVASSNHGLKAENAFGVRIESLLL